MSSDLRSTLARIAPSPRDRLNVSSLIREAARRRHKRYLGYSLLGVATALAVAFVVPDIARETIGDRGLGPAQLPEESLSRSPTTRDVGGCPLTIPPRPGLVPPRPYAARPPDLYQAVWYGSAELWTMLDPQGEVWEDLPQDDGGFTQKTFWWSDGYSPGQEPAPPITVTGRRLDRPGSFEVAGRGGGGFRDDIGSFMLVGLEIPAGCWELTGTYRGADLSYVVLVRD